MIFTALSSPHFKEIIAIANQVLGKGFLTSTTLKEYINNPNKKALVVLMDQQVVGFINIDLTSSQQRPSVLLNEVDDLNGLLNIALIKQVIVLPSYQKKGFGKQLIQKIIEQNQLDNTTYLCIAWKTGNNIPIKKALIHNGFNVEKEISNYWFSDSLQYQYHCLVCGAPPCKCNAVVFVRNTTF